MPAPAKSIWVYPPKDPALLQAITTEFNIHPVIAQILISRGYKTMEEVHEFLYAKLPHLHAPDLFPDMDLAVERVIRAVKPLPKRWSRSGWAIQW